jgi:exoribonuclease R
MLTSKSFNKLTRRGKLLRVLREHYLRDDIPCGAQGCAACAGAGDVDGAGGGGGAAVVTAVGPSGGGVAAALGAVQLSADPPAGYVVVADTNIVLHQIDVLEAAGGAITDVVVLQTVLDETRHRHLGTYNRLLALMCDGARRFVPFANEHHPETYAPRGAGEGPNDYSDRLVRRAAAWLAAHYEPLGLRVLLLTDDADNGRRAGADHGLRVHTMRSFVSYLVARQREQQSEQQGGGGADEAAAPAAGSSSSGGSTFAGAPPLLPATTALSRLADLVANREDEEDEEYAGDTGAAAKEPSSSSSSSSSVAATAAPKPSAKATAATAVLASPPPTTATTTAAAGVVRKRRGPGMGAGSGSGAGPLYREHWPPARLAAAVKSRSAFQGTLRVNRECWYEARVAVHGVLSGKARSEGERLAVGGGEDVVSVLIHGREAINRAMEGDTVVIQLLPVSQWRHPSTTLAVPDANKAAGGGAGGEADADDAPAGDAAPGAGEDEGGAAAAAGSAVLPAGDDNDATSATTGGTAADLRHVMQAQALGDASATAADDDSGDDADAAAAVPRDAGHDAAVEELRRAARRAAALGGAGAGSSGGGGGKPGATPSYLPGGVVPTGRVVGVIKRAWRHYCGSLEPDETAATSSSSAVVAGGVVDGGAATASALFVPVDPKIPRIRIDTRQRGSLGNMRLVVAVDGWGVWDRYPRGHYVRTIGPIGDRAAETEVILLEHDIPFRPFSADVLACLPPADWGITPANSAGRTDLRALDCVCSIDPPGCKDIDDALHARWVPHPAGAGSGLPPVLEVGVHIADVSYFVRPGTAIDVEAAHRSNTTYLVERRLDMLPGLLTETLCSLKGGVDRFAFSVTWLFEPVLPTGSATAAAAAAARSMDADPEAGLPRSDDGTGVLAVSWRVVPGSVKYFKSIIHSSAAMTYAAAQALLDAPGPPPTPVARGVKLLTSVARGLRAGRKDAGALSLASPEVRFQLDSETADPVNVSAYELKETNSVVEEFMLLANIWTARRTAEAFPRCAMLRRHPAPPASQFDALLAAAAAVGVTIRTDSSRALADSLDEAVVAGGSAYVNKLLRILATRCMMQAAYFPSGAYSPPEYAHYGLATPIYTHFTSPIRRYADVIVHRLLSAALSIDPLPGDYEDLDGMRKLCDVMNKRHLMSQLAGRASGSLHTNLFFRRRVVVEAALVLRVRANGVALLVPRFGLEGVVLLGRAAVASTGNDGKLPLLKAALGAGKPPRAGAADAERVLTNDEAAQTLADASDPGRLQLRVFDEVRVALVVEERVRFRPELVLRVIDPPFQALPFPLSAPPDGMTVEDATGGRPMANAATKAAAAAAVLVAAASSSGAGGSKKQPRPADDAAGTGKSPTAAPPPAAKKAKK